MKGNKILFHNYFFLFGCIYYLVIPPFLGMIGYWKGMLSMNVFYENFPDAEGLCKYFYMVFGLIIPFYCGSLLPMQFRTRSKHKCDIDSKINLLKNRWILYILIIFNQYIIIINRSILFTGYSVIYDKGFLGELSTLNCFYLFLYIYSHIKNSNGNKLLLVLLIENSIILMGLGSRMFVLIPFIAFAIYYFEYFSKNKKRIIFISLLFIVLCVFVGVWRVGKSGISYDALLYIAFAEPMYTWISAGSFINLNSDVDLISFPHNFIGHFINVIPSIILPNKASYITIIPYKFNNPLGASSIILNMYGNFGIVLSPIFMFIGGMMMTFVRYSKTTFGQVYYYCICSMIPFLFFRDLQSFNKLLFASFLIYPSVFTIFRITRYNNGELSS